MFSFAFGEDIVERKRVSEHLQNISVTIKSKGDYSESEGSGVLIVREIKGEKVTFVWTAAHVIDNLRSVREVINEDGQPRKVVEFKDPQVVKELWATDVAEGLNFGGYIAQIVGESADNS